MDSTTFVQPQHVSHCIISGQWGIFAPQFFARKFPTELWGLSEEDTDILLSGPGHPMYFETWAETVEYSKFHYAGTVYYLVVSDEGDVYAVPKESIQ